jgi:hypothetical protein
MLSHPNNKDSCIKQSMRTITHLLNLKIIWRKKHITKNNHYLVELREINKIRCKLIKKLVQGGMTIISV